MFENQRKCFAENGEVVIDWISEQKVKGDHVNSTLIRQEKRFSRILRVVFIYPKDEFSA
jgi:hypothetical protein